MSLQSQFADVSDAELKKMDSRIAEISTEVQTISQSCRQLDSGVHLNCAVGKDEWFELVHRLPVFDKTVIFLPTELKELNSSLTTAEMKAQIQELQAECSGYRERLDKIKSATNHVTPEEREKVRNHCVLQCLLIFWPWLVKCTMQDLVWDRAA